MGARKSNTRSHFGALAFVTAILLGGCGGSSDNAAPSREREASIVQPGAPGEPSRTLSAGEASKLESTKHTTADVDFMRGMIHHHAQALVMTSLVRKRSASADIPLLARRMEISQQSEIEVMERWLTDRGETPPDADDHRHNHGAHGRLMPGMVSAAKLARLAAADGREFDRLFLAYMTRHHRGALTMVSQLVAANGGAEPEIGAFTRHVEADQEIEIGRMRELLLALEREPSRSAPRRARPSRAAAKRATRFAFAGGRPRICFIG